MSSSVDAGYYADQMHKKSQESCKRSPTGKHEPVATGGHPPSQEFSCKHCGVHLGYSK